MTNWDAKPLKLSKPQLLITVKQSSALIRAAFQRGVAEGKKEWYTRACDDCIEICKEEAEFSYKKFTFKLLDLAAKFEKLKSEKCQS